MAYKSCRREYEGGIFIFKLILNLWYFWILVLVVIIYLLNKTNVKDNINKKTISVLLTKLEPTKYKVIDHLIFTVDGKMPRIGNTFEIDYAVISNYGVFIVVENDYKRWASGKDLMYTQVLRQILAEYPHLNLIPIIVFPDKVEIKEKTNSKVIYSVNLLETIEKYMVKTLTNQEKDAIYLNLVNLNMNMFTSTRLMR